MAAPPSDSIPSADSADSADTFSRTPSFATYAEYLRALKYKDGTRGRQFNGLLETLSTRKAASHGRPGMLNLLRFGSDGQLNYFHRDGNAEQEDASQWDSVPIHKRSFWRILTNFDDSVAYQVILLKCDYARVPCTWIVDTLGLGLDIDPLVWAFFTSHFHTADKKSRESGEVCNWSHRRDILRVGDDVLILLDEIPNVRSRTAVIFLLPTPSIIQRVFDRAAYSIMHVSDTPSSLSKQPTLIQGIDLPDVPDEDWKCHAVRRSIVNSGEPLANLKSSNVFLRCVASLLEWQMSCAPQYALIYPQFHGELPMKYWHQSPFIGFHDVRERWLDLRRETDSRRTTLLSLPIFLAVNFRRPGDQLIEACARLVDAYEAYVKGLGIEEAALKDYIEVQSSGSSTEMARISIQESKRVILLTFLAFVFLPISLASSIYGMNVQQINQTGHHIGVFVATAFLLLLTTFGLWLVSAAFVAVRASLSDKYEEKQRNNPVQRLTLRDKIFLVGQSLRWPF